MRHTLIALLVFTTSLQAQTFPTSDPVIRRIWDEGMTDKSRVEPLSQVLLDSIGPRLSGTPGLQSAVDWLQQVYRGWGVTTRAEQYGTWRGWRRGTTHIDLIAPQVRTLEGTMLAWSPGTEGPVDGEVVAFPDLADSAAYAAWLPSAKGKFVVITPAEPTCRGGDSWEKLARPESVQRLRQRREQAMQAGQAGVALPRRRRRCVIRSSRSPRISPPRPRVSSSCSWTAARAMWTRSIPSRC